MTGENRPEEVFEEVREKDRVVLQCIENGENDVQYITSATTLANSEVNYSFDKLDDLGLVTVEKPDGMVDRVVDGTRQVFEAPKQASLTDLGQEFLDSTEEERSEEYRDLTRDELVEKVRALEDDLQELEQRFDVFSRQVKNRLFD